MAGGKATRSFHALDTSSVEKLLCCDCGKTYRTKSGLRKHKIAKHTDNQPYHCCGKSYVERSSLEAHKRSHHNKRRLKFDKCSQTFTRKSALKRHMKCHGQSDFTCNICQRKFLRGDELDDHNKGVHEKAKRFTCSVCSKKYVWRASLRRHIFQPLISETYLSL